MYGEETQQSIWNFDGAELFLIFSIKQMIVEALESWDLETAYWKLRLLRMEVDAKLQRTKKRIILEQEKKLKGKVSKMEKDVMDNKIKNLAEKYSEFKSIIDPSDEEKSNFYNELEEFYLYICHIMKKHGLYFREGEDNTLAILKR